MKILIIAYLFPPTNEVGALRPYGWAKYWSETGHEVSVITAKDIPGVLKNDYNLKKVNVYKIPHNDLISQLKYKIKKLLGRNNYPVPTITDLWWVKAYKKALSIKCNFVISTYNPYINHWIGYLLKRKNKNLIWVADYRDLWTENHYLQPKAMNRIFNNFLEKKFNLTANFLTTVSVPLAITLSSKYPQAKAYSIENGYDLADLDILPNDNFWNDQLIHLVSTGTIYPNKQNILPLIKGIKLISQKYINLEEKLQIHLVGNIPDEARQAIKKENFEKIILCEPQTTRANCLQMQRDAYALIFFGYKYKNPNALPSAKIYEYLISGSPIIGIGTSDNHGVGKLICEAKAGVNCEEDINSIQSIIEGILISGTKQELNINYQYLEQFDKKNLSMKLLQLVENIENH